MQALAKDACRRIRGGGSSDNLLLSRAESKEVLYSGRSPYAVIVLKFGGSSLESPQAVNRVAAIIGDRASLHPVVVVSALGRTTDRLLDIAHAAVDSNADLVDRIFSELRRFTFDLARAVCPKDRLAALETVLGEHFEELSAIVGRIAGGETLDAPRIDQISAFGERISSLIITEALTNNGLRGEHVDARSVIVTDDRNGQAAPLFEETQARLVRDVKPLVEQGKIPVLGGFIASNRAGETTTLSRGGSDYSAALIGGGLGADEVQIWTDVDGVMTADPSLIPSASSIKVMSFGEASELAYFGGRVLHPATMLPAIEHDIPIRVLNSRSPDAGGTLIVKEAETASTVVKSIAYKESITLVDIRSTRMLMAHGFLAEIFGVFEKHDTAVDMVSTSEISVSLTVDKPERLPQILEDLEHFAQVETSAGRAIVCVVGEGIRYTPGIAAKVFAALDGIRIDMISLGASRLNIGFVISEDDVEQAVNLLHSTFFDAANED